MYCDRTAASKIYMKDAYHDGSAYEYFMRGYHPVSYTHLDVYKRQALHIKNTLIAAALKY